MDELRYEAPETLDAAVALLAGADGVVDGIRPRSLPMSPPKVLKLIEEAQLSRDQARAALDLP